MALDKNFYIRRGLSVGTAGEVVDSSGNWVGNAIGGIDSATAISLMSIDNLSDGYNNGNSVGLGSGALANDDGTTNRNTAVGNNALNSVDSGTDNTAVGNQAGLNTTGIRNTFLGMSAGRSITSGDNNVAIGCGALFGSTSTGNDNVAIGKSTLINNTSGKLNVVVGSAAGTLTTTGKNQIIIGYNAEPSSAIVDNEITLGNGLINSFRIPGLQNTATHGQVLAFDSAGGDIAFTTIATGSVDSATIQAIIDSDWTARGINDLSDGFAAGQSFGLGTSALANDDGTTNRNTAVGYNALPTLTTGTNNAALGFNAGTYARGDYNIALGSTALSGNSTLFTGDYNIGIGFSAGFNLTTGTDNILLGKYAGQDITEGGNNIAIGPYAGNNITTGNNVIAIGDFAGYTTTTVSEAVYIGYRAGWQATGADNTFVGSRAGFDVTTGAQNTIIGDFAGNSGTNNLTTGSNNILLGYQAAASDSAASNEITLGNSSITSFRIPGLQSTATHGQVLAFDSDGGDIAFTTIATGLDSATIQASIDSDWTARGINDLNDGFAAGSSVGLGTSSLANDDGTSNQNTAVGNFALTSLTTGRLNAALGYNSGRFVNGISNIALGSEALRGNSTFTGNYNIGAGYHSGFNLTTASNNVLLGYQAGYEITEGDNNIAIGQNAGNSGTNDLTTGSNNILIGYQAAASDSAVSNEITLGDTNIKTFRIPALSYSIDSTGEVSAVNFNTTSDVNLKENIQQINNGLDIVNKINPVSFNWKSSGKKSYGVIAQEIEQLIPEAVSTNIEGNKQVNYIQLIAFLVDAVQDQQRQIDQLKNKL